MTAAPTISHADLAALKRPLALPAPLPASVNRVERERALRALHDEMQACDRCVLAGYLDRAASVAGYCGRIGDQILLAGQAPGHLSVERGRPFSGPGGFLLDKWFQRAGFPEGTLWRDVYITAMTRCDPGKSPKGSGDRKPSPAEVALCRPYLLRELELVRPEVILAVGGMAIEAFLGQRKLDDTIGQSFERNGVLLIPVPHPSGVSRWLNDPDHQALLGRALAILSDWREHHWSPVQSQTA